MSVSGLKKQFNKASQLVNEKVLKASHTEVDDSFRELERKTDGTIEVVKSLSEKVVSLLQPNPAARVKAAYRVRMDRAKGISGSTASYPHAEATLSDIALKGSAELSEDSNFGLALGEFASSLREITDLKENMDVTVNQNFVDPIMQFLQKDAKEISHHRKKMESRRLDFDGKRRKKDKGANIADADLIMAEEKFEESKELAESGMLELLEGDAEQISQLQSLTEAMLEMHRESADILTRLRDGLQERASSSQTRPRSVREPRAATRRSLQTVDISSPVKLGMRSPQEDSSGNSVNGAVSDAPPVAANRKSSSPAVPGGSSGKQQAHCKALYDFEAENEGELSFEEGDTIILTGRIDENWLEGEVKSTGKAGYFPQNYVEIIVDL
ncbi:endophilin-A1-like [Sycon ciliatum]|uniref:endophilin-A1-like n=1 Tax=Sycon ciliatum TaxID=27933 RepID=UPI0031F6164A